MREEDESPDATDALRYAIDSIPTGACVNIERADGNVLERLAENFGINRRMTWENGREQLESDTELRERIKKIIQAQTGEEIESCNFQEMLDKI